MLADVSTVPEHATMIDDRLNSSPSFAIRLADAEAAADWSACDALGLQLAELGTAEEQLVWSDFLIRRGRFGEVLSQLGELLTEAEQQGNLPLVGAVCSRFAIAYRCVGDWRTAQRFQARALHHTNDCGADELLHLAQQALAAKNWNLADSLSRFASQLATDDDELQGHVLATRGLAAAGHGDLARATKLLRRGRDAHRRARCVVALCQDWINASAVAAQMDRTDLEVRCLERAVGLATRHSDAAWLHQQASELLTRARLTHGSRSFDATRN
jgi:hypothetical protein